MCTRGLLGSGLRNNNHEELHKARLGKGERELRFSCSIGLTQSLSGMAFQSCTKAKRPGLCMINWTLAAATTLIEGQSHELPADLTPSSPGNEHLGCITASVAIDLVFIGKENLSAFLWWEGFCRIKLKARFWNWLKSCAL